VAASREPVAKALGTPLPIAHRRASDGRALRPEKLASEALWVNSVCSERSLEAGFFLKMFLLVKTLRATDQYQSSQLVEGLVSGIDRTRQWAVLGLELALDRLEHLERPFERVAIVRGHHARAQQRSARRHRGM
jgi:hypothetical protein